MQKKAENARLISKFMQKKANMQKKAKMQKKAENACSI